MHQNPEEHATLAVFAPSLFVTVTAESPADGRNGDKFAEIHFHPGGQGFWIARALGHLGERPVVIAPVGGEAGEVLRALAGQWGVGLHAVDTVGDTPAYLHDRRDGERIEIARSPSPPLTRHELDNFYSAVLDRAADVGFCVITGRSPGDQLPLDFFRRLGADLAAIGVAAIGDLHGEELAAFLSGGPLHTLKVSSDDLVADGALGRDAAPDECMTAIRHLNERGAQRVVVSRAGGPSIACFGNVWLSAEAPRLQVVDHRGAGDSMTAGLALAARQGIEPAAALAYSCAAGAANVTRRGLGNVEPRLVHDLASRVQVDELKGGNP